MAFKAQRVEPRVEVVYPFLCGVFAVFPGTHPLRCFDAEVAGYLECRIKVFSVTRPLVNPAEKSSP